MLLVSGCVSLPRTTGLGLGLTTHEDIESPSAVITTVAVALRSPLQQQCCLQPFLYCASESPKQQRVRAIPMKLRIGTTHAVTSPQHGPFSSVLLHVCCSKAGRTAEIKSAIIPKDTPPQANLPSAALQGTECMSESRGGWKYTLLPRRQQESGWEVRVRRQGGQQTRTHRHTCATQWKTVCDEVGVDSRRDESRCERDSVGQTYTHTHGGRQAGRQECTLLTR
jgi:hypothetical protein